MLSNRVAVLVEGNVFCLGSVDYINRNFGVGYHLIVTKADHSKIDGELQKRIDAIVKEHISDYDNSGQQSTS